MTASAEDLRAIERLLEGLSSEKREKLISMPGISQALNQIWLPNPGPQTDAYYCEADELLYGGEAGGGKSDLLVGLAYNEHKRSRILRRINQDAAELGGRLVEILGSDANYKLNPPTFKDAERYIEFRGCELERDKQRYKGKARDFIGYDELADFLESQYLFINTWNRSADKNQRCRIVGATNGPTTAEGMWIVKRWAAWLDPQHPNPAKSGEIRWYMTIDGQDVEVDGPGPHDVRGKKILATSRTFIRSRLDDNPDLAETDYGDKLEQLPEELRRVYKEGDFTVGLRDEDFQVIPTQWIIDAQDRWTEDGHKGLAMTAMAVDCAGGGADPAIIAYRYGGWFGEFAEVQGKETANGQIMLSHVLANRHDECPIIVDVGGGYAGPLIERFTDNGISFGRFNGSDGTSARARGSNLRFYNKRAMALWRLREELDPDQEGGSPIKLPPDPELRGELAAATWKITPRGIQIIDKDEIKKKIGRSPNKADAVMMALVEGDRKVAQKLSRHGRTPRVILGYSKSKRR